MSGLTGEGSSASSVAALEGTGAGPLEARIALKGRVDGPVAVLPHSSAGVLEHLDQVCNPEGAADPAQRDIARVAKPAPLQVIGVLQVGQVLNDQFLAVSEVQLMPELGHPVGEVCHAGLEGSDLATAAAALALHLQKLLPEVFHILHSVHRLMNDTP